MDYKNKYLKYKNKYLNLINQLGGECSQPIFRKNKTALELLENKECTFNNLPFLFTNAEEAKKLGFRFKIIQPNFPLDKLVNTLKTIGIKSLVILNELNYFEGVTINDWIRELYFTTEEYPETWSDGTIIKYKLNGKTQDLLILALDWVPLRQLCLLITKKITIMFVVVI